MIKIWTLLFSAFLALPHPTRAQGLRPAEVRGCWDLQFGAWDPPPAQPLDTLRYLPPPRVELDTVPLSESGPESQSFIARPAPNSRGTRHRFSGWRIEGDSILAGWSTGYVGVRLHLGLEGDNLLGYAETFSDAYQPGDGDYRARVTAVRIPCSTAPDFPDAGSRFVLRSITLESGESIELGKPLPDRDLIESRRNNRTFVIRGPARGVFAGASEIRVEEARSGVIREIRLLFPPGTSAEELRTGLEEVMGGKGNLPSGNSVLLAGWEDVATSVSLAAYDGRVEVLIWDPRLL